GRPGRGAGRRSAVPIRGLAAVRAGDDIRRRDAGAARRKVLPQPAADGFTAPTGDIPTLVGATRGIRVGTPSDVHRVIWGSRASRSPSHRNFRQKSVVVSAAPGKRMSQG